MPRRTRTQVCCSTSQASASSGTRRRRKYSRGRSQVRISSSRPPRAPPAPRGAGVLGGPPLFCRGTSLLPSSPPPVGASPPGGLVHPPSVFSSPCEVVSRLAPGGLVAGPPSPPRRAGWVGVFVGGAPGRGGAAEEAQGGGEGLGAGVPGGGAWAPGGAGGVGGSPGPNAPAASTSATPTSAPTAPAPRPGPAAAPDLPQDDPEADRQLGPPVGGVQPRLCEPERQVAGAGGGASRARPRSFRAERSRSWRSW